MPSFEETWDSLSPKIPQYSGGQVMKDFARYWFDQGQTQATFAANSKLGDEGNEGMKHERMVKAAAAISILYPGSTADWDKLKAIIEEAQG